ncbi:DNA-directed RNA polymerase subunit beta [Lapidilactobacillus luobeiensis]|uniref:DNA-directed RNA polymerase subunit beta n=1 Tax=Lapidilactobacillus luobeiensis TaxID=2950371 RepID=UPI0021C2CB4F|nr:DNA-directed RNA polymerase subunit beta [Lapidilactobacillus luobeiensis]
MKFRVDKKHVFSGLRYIGITLLIMVIALLVGSVIGYGISGKGNPFQVFSPQTWQHVLDFLR